MLQQRQAAPRDSAQEEDRRLFSGKVVQIPVHLVPQISQSSEGDIVVTAFMDGGRAIDVVFPGRRAQQCMPLISKLRAKLAQALNGRDVQTAELNINDHRFPARIEGTWRPRFSRDIHGWQTHRHQLYAARWLVLGPAGAPVTYGESPRR